MFNHIYSLAPKLLTEPTTLNLLTKKNETEREKLVRQAQEGDQTHQIQDDLAKCA